MSLGGGGTQTSTTNSEPWVGVQDDLNTILDWSNFQFTQPRNPYPHITYTNLSPDTQTGMDMTRSAIYGDAHNIPAGAQVNVRQTLGGEWLNNQPGMGYLQNTLTSDPASNPAADYLGATASGAMLNSNPYLDSMFDTASGKVRSAIDSQFNDAGRYASGAHQDVLMENYGDLANQIYGDNYARERQNQLAASGMIQGAYDTAMGRNISSAMGVNDMFSDERARQIQSLALAPGVYDFQFAPADKMMQLGAIDENQQMKALTDDMYRYNFYQDDPWVNISRYASIANGLPVAGYGLNTAAQPTYGGSPIMGALGGGMAGAGLASGLVGATGGSAGLLGSGMGAASLGLAGLPVMGPLAAAGAIAGLFS